MAKLDRIRALDASPGLWTATSNARERPTVVARYHGIRLAEDSVDTETCEATIGLEAGRYSPDLSRA